MAILHSTAAILFLSALTSHQNDAGAGGLASAFTSPKIHQRSLYTHRSILGVSSSSSTDATKAATETTTKKVDFNPSLNPTDIDSSNTPPSLHTILTTLSELKSGSDLRGTFVPHNSSGGTIANIAHLVKTIKEESGAIALTPFAAHCYGVAFAHWLIEKNEVDNDNENTPPQAGRPGKKNGHGLAICIGRDPRLHGERLADAFARGAESVDGGTGPVRVVYTGLATTPSMYEFVRAGKCDAAVMVSASHLPEEMNGLKFFSKNGGLTKKNIDELVTFVKRWTPPLSSNHPHL